MKLDNRYTALYAGIRMHYIYSIFNADNLIAINNFRKSDTILVKIVTK